MKHALILVMLLTVAAPARAQLGGIGGAMKKALPGT